MRSRDYLLLSYKSKHVTDISAVSYPSNTNRCYKCLELEDNDN